MKKSIVIIGILLVVFGLFINSRLGYQEDMQLSDIDAVTMYVNQMYDVPDDYVITVRDNDADDKYMVYEVRDKDGAIIYGGLVLRSYCLSCVTK